MEGSTKPSKSRWLNKKGGISPPFLFFMQRIKHRHRVQRNNEIRKITHIHFDSEKIKLLPSKIIVERRSVKKTDTGIANLNPYNGFHTHHFLEEDLND